MLWSLKKLQSPILDLRWMKFEPSSHNPGVYGEGEAKDASWNNEKRGYYHRIIYEKNYVNKFWRSNWILWMKKLRCKPTQRPLRRKTVSLHLCVLRNWSELATLRVYFVINYYTFLFLVYPWTNDRSRSERTARARTSLHNVRSRTDDVYGEFYYVRIIYVGGLPLRLSRVYRAFVWTRAAWRRIINGCNSSRAWCNQYWA